jgi:hypothetical protein
LPRDLVVKLFAVIIKLTAIKVEKKLELNTHVDDKLKGKTKNTLTVNFVKKFSHFLLAPFTVDVQFEIMCLSP